MRFLYRQAAGPDDFPWHEDKPPRLLEEAIASRPKRGRALDVGCGSGFYTVYLARQGPGSSSGSIGSTVGSSSSYRTAPALVRPTA
jgi:SAM-dependent methyltransferase